MIYLFEDRIDRMNACLKEPLDELRIKHIQQVDSTKQEVEDYVGRHFADASLVLLHRSFHFMNDQMNPQIFQHIFNVRNVPVVIFSGDNNGSSISTCGKIYNGVMNSKIMYEHLPDFLKKNDERNISRLIYGDKYVLNILLKFQKRVYECLFNVSEDSPLNKKSIYDIQDLMSILKGAELDKAKVQLKKIIDKGITGNDLTASIFKTHLQNLIEEY